MAVEEQGQFPQITFAYLLHGQIVFHLLGITPEGGKGYRELRIGADFGWLMGIFFQAITFPRWPVLGSISKRG